MFGRRGQAVQHCVAFRHRCDVLGLGIARPLDAWVETPVRAVCERDDEIDASAAVAVGIFGAALTLMIPPRLRAASTGLLAGLFRMSVEDSALTALGN